MARQPARVVVLITGGDMADLMPTGGDQSPVLQALEEFVAEQLAGARKKTMRAYVRSAVDHLRGAFIAAGVPIRVFVAEDRFRPRVDELSRSLECSMLYNYKGIWRLAFNELCRRKLLSLSYELCVLPAEGRDPHDPDADMAGFAQAWLGVHPRSTMSERTLTSIALDDAVPALIKEQFRLAVANINECKTDATKRGHWIALRKIVRALGIASLKDLTTVPGAQRLAAHFRDSGYHRESSMIRRMYTLFSALTRAGITGNPFKMKIRAASGQLGYIIDYTKLKDQALRDRFVVVDGRRHVKIDGVATECRLRLEDLEKVKAYGNPQLAKWETQPEAELERIFREAQENLITRTVLYFPPRPAELWAMNRGSWSPIEGDSSGRFFLVRNNVRRTKKKRRSDWVVPRSFVSEWEDLYRLRRAVFGRRRDVDLRESFRVPMVQSGIAMLVAPRTGDRFGQGSIIKALRRGLVRMGVDPKRACRATSYWLRKAHQAAVRARVGTAGDKFIAEQASQSEAVLRSSYDGPEAVARAEFLAAHLWSANGVMDAPSTATGSRTYAGSAPSQSSSTGISRLAEALLSGTPGVDPALGDQLGERVCAAAYEAGLLCSLEDASVRLDLDLRTLQRWAADGHLRVYRRASKRYALKADVQALSDALSAEEAGHLIGALSGGAAISDRQVRNLVRDEKIKGALSTGRKILIPVASVREYVRAKSDGGNFRKCTPKISGIVATVIPPPNYQGGVSDSSFA